MSQTTRNAASDPDRPSFLEELYQGRFRWDLLRDFPVQDPGDARAGDRLVEELADLLRERVDPDELDARRAMPEGLPEELGARGYFALQAGPGTGGRGASHYNTFRAVEAAARVSTPVALSLAIENALGASAFLPVVPEGPLRELLAGVVRRGGRSASADSEPEGAANQRRTTTATRIEGTDDYLLNGRKVFVGHAPVAEVVSVTATVREDDAERVRIFFVRTDSPGVTSGAWHEYMGIKGFPNGRLEFDDVRVPGSQMLVEADSGHVIRQTPATARLVTRGRLHLIAAPALAVARLCAGWSRDFAERRIVDGRPLSDYEEVQRQLADTLAETFAIESLAQWCLLPDDQDRGLNLRYEQTAAKNAASLLGWAIADRTTSLLAAEGYETAASKRDRGAPPIPLERFVRDLRNLRISGGVDFQIDNWIGRLSILSYYYPEPDHAAELLTDGPAPLDTDGTVLSPRNLGHLRTVAAEVHRFGRTCLELSRSHPVKDELLAKERTLVLLAGIARELLCASVVLARASALSAAGDDGGQALADVFCVSALQRADDLRRRLHAAPGPDFAAVSDAWTSGAGFTFLDPHTVRAEESHA
ncbi:acyl-CoA/acyl-ACP dehydrogenase [Streptomyces sp. AV19]|uniref:acyl-CoA dehydrogenase family protein n=1 Tax=Streptomyces sp. AV19 TaxID=2793068 RepID=UPI0018FE2743|nr:acyl-CoA dehydrogenase family protein [Streptomyces sp. AV19]MBH1934822.1 acyl-CoA/acyl-ACP dehydrogenase [Streptomyces sp. AV19]MDG4530573.1 acyl-CoA/acyl-ACP dehydrogenase [Streptomyces sp. AV19]